MSGDQSLSGPFSGPLTGSSTPPALIAIDGPAAAGKGTLARRLAAHLDYAVLDTGSLYRGVALLAVQAGDDPADAAAALAAAQKLDIAAIDAEAIRTPEIGLAAAKIAVHPDVRACILHYQRDFAAHPPHDKAGAILDGRDIGTYVCPQAPCKIYVTARAEIRAHRRWLELSAKDDSLTEAQVLADVLARDKTDAEREIAPLRPADDAHLLDTSDLGIESAFRTALALVEKSGT